LEKRLPRHIYFDLNSHLDSQKRSAFSLGISIPLASKSIRACGILSHFSGYGCHYIAPHGAARPVPDNITVCRNYKEIK
jgi:hypothetical protein